MKRALLLFAALGWVSIAGAADARFNAFMGQVVGNSATVTFGSGGQPLVTSSAGLGTPTLGNMSLSQSGKDVSLAGGVRVPLGDTGKHAGAIARAPITRAAFLRGLGAVVSNPLVGIGFAIAAPEIGAWLAGRGVRMNPDAADYPEKPFLLAKDAEWEGFEYSYNGILWRSSPGSAAGDWIAVANKQQGFSYWVTSIESGGAGYFYNCTKTVFDGSSYVSVPCFDTPQRGGLHKRKTTGVSVEELPASLDDIAPYMDAPEAPALTPSIVHEGVTKAGIDPFGGQYPKPAVTGPATVPGQKTETSTQVRVHPGTTTEVAPGTNTETQQATKTTTTTATHNVTYNENKVTYNTTNITNTTITNNVTNQTSTTTDTTKVEDDSKVEDKPEDPAVDTPLGDIPKLYERKYPDGIVGIWNDKSQQIKETPLATFVQTLMPTGFVSGTCPSWTIDLSLAQWADMGTHVVEAPCWVWGVAKTIVIISALLLARSLIFGG